jgi:hypothetical protein
MTKALIMLNLLKRITLTTVMKNNSYQEISLVGRVKSRRLTVTISRGNAEHILHV